jgi:hypothetical protein
MEVRTMWDHARKPPTHQGRDGAPRCLRETGEGPTHHVCLRQVGPFAGWCLGSTRSNDQVRNLRMALSDLKIQVSDLAAAFGRG